MPASWWGLGPGRAAAGDRRLLPARTPSSWQVQASGQSALLWAGLGGAFLTSLYTFRLIFIAFHGKVQTEAHAGHGLAHQLPLLVLLVLSTGSAPSIVPPWRSAAGGPGIISRRAVTPSK